MIGFLKLLLGQELPGALTWTLISFKISIYFIFIKYFLILFYFIIVFIVITTSTFRFIDSLDPKRDEEELFSELECWEQTGVPPKQAFRKKV